MASDERSEKAEAGTVPEVANLGIVRPPFVYLCAIVLGMVLHFAHHDRAHGALALSLEPQSHLSVFLAAAARSRILGQ